MISYFTTVGLPKG